MKPSTPAPLAKSGSAAGSGVSAIAVKVRFVLLPKASPGLLPNPASPPEEVVKARVQQVTAGGNPPKATKSADVSTPPETENKLAVVLGLAYSPTPKPAGLLVTWTLGAS